MEFPVYIKHVDDSVFYEVLSSKHFNECKRLGASKYPLPSTYIYTEIVQGDYSTAVYIADLLESVGLGKMIFIPESEYFEIKESI